MKIQFPFLLIILALFETTYSEISLPAVIASKMMLQREMTAPIWGMAKPGEEVTVTFNSQTLKTTAEADGKWKVKLAAMKAGGPYSMTISGTNSLQLENILIGDVWLCGGQSNMGFALKTDINAATEIPQSTNPLIRTFVAPQSLSETPLWTGKGTWEECNPTTIGTTSAVGYYFAKELQKKLKIPIGIIKCAHGASSAEAWMAPAAMQNNPEFETILERWTKSQELSHVESSDPLTALPTPAEGDRGEGTKSTKKKLSTKTPSICYNGMLYSIVPYAIRGVIWYQGEANARFGKEYRTVFPALIAHWRDLWGQPELPFLFAQLTRLEKIPLGLHWPLLRESQLVTVKTLPQTAMATTLDVGERDDIHPKNKKPVGDRLALAALGMVYGQPGEIMGPLYKSSKTEEGKIKISFDHIGSGLMIKDGLSKGFEIAGEDRKFLPAEAKIDGETVIVSSPQVPSPLSVRYAWSDFPDYSLFNKEELLASPFRTDDWSE